MYLAFICKSKKRQSLEEIDLVYRVRNFALSILDHTVVQVPSGIWVLVLPRDLVVGKIGKIARD